MTASPLNLLLVDEDPVFRLGLRIWLEQQSDFAVVGEATDSEAAITTLTELQTAAINSATDAGINLDAPAVDVVIIDLGLSQGQPEQLMGLQLCSEIKQQFPTVAVLVLSAQTEPVLQAAAAQMGADGFGARGLPVRALARLIQQTAQPRPEPVEAVADDIVFPQPLEGPIAYLNRTSVEQIDAAMAEIEQLTNQRLSYWYRLVLAGKHRELRAARWLVQRILPVDPATESSQSHSPQSAESTSSPTLLSEESTASSGVPNDRAITRLRGSVPVAVGDVRSRVCDAVFRKLQFPLENRSAVPLEIDILRPDKTRELLYTTLRSLENLLDDLTQAEVLPGQLED